MSIGIDTSRLDTLPESTLQESTLRLQQWMARRERVFVLTGAGCSTASGIPDYRDGDGQWKRAQPVTYQAFVADPLVRSRYWARSFSGWPRFEQACPNTAHAALAAWQPGGALLQLLTQNVDGLHQQAGSTEVIDLHGRLDEVVCLDCGGREPRSAVQQRMRGQNPDWIDVVADLAPDGDADLNGVDFARFVAPTCGRCGGMLKPDVVFFGESVPRVRYEAARAALDAADALLVIGSSLMVYSGYRFARQAHERGVPLAIVNVGVTRADGLADLKLEEDCARLLPLALATNAEALPGPRSPAPAG